MPPRQARLIQAWIEIHREELMADWTLAIRGEALVKVDPLRWDKTMNPRVTAATAHDDCSLHLTFANGEIRRFDATPFVASDPYQRQSRRSPSDHCRHRCHAGFRKALVLLAEDGERKLPENQGLA